MSRLSQTLKKEFYELIPPTLFFFVALHIVALIRSLMAKGSGIPLSTTVSIAVSALILGKAVLLADMLPIIDRFPQRPLIYNVSWKTLVYFVIAGLLHYAERLFDFVHEAGGLIAGNERLIAEMVWPRFWAIQILLLVLILMYCTIDELVRAVGKETSYECSSARRSAQVDPGARSASCGLRGPAVSSTSPRRTTMTERMIDSNGIRLWTEDFGDPNDPTLLLVMGASAQGIQWPEPFIEAFVARGFYVIRYDNRDTGQSTCFDFATSPYTLDDLANDAVGVLDAYGVRAAHVAGASMGGMITQTLMIRYPHRLKSATIIMSSPLAGSVDGVPMLAAKDLPGPDPRWLADFVATQQSMPSATAADLIEMRVAMFTKLAGKLPVDTAAIRDVATREVGRAVNFAAQANHSLAIGASAPNDRRPLLARTTVPTLVVHGTEDPILPYPHGKALADAIPGARLLTIDGMGHDLPVQVWPSIIDAMLAVMQRA